MRKVMLMVLPAVVSGSVAAEWVEVGYTSVATVYVDPATIRRNGNLVKMETLYNLKTAIVSMTNGKPYVSQKMQSEFDCKEEKWRMHYFSWYSRNMGGGEMVEHVSDSYAWRPVPPGSGNEIFWEIACDKTKLK